MTVNEVKDIYELSPLQKLQMVNSILENDNTGYEQLLYLLEGEINIDYIRSVWEKIFDSHTILKTSFIWEDLPKPLQVVNSGLNLDFQTYDYNGNQDGEFEDFLETVLKTDYNNGIDINKAPLFRIKLIKFHESKLYMLFSFHHLILDGWSTGILINQFINNYISLLKGENINIMSSDYKDYISWIDQNTDEKQYSEFWSNNLSGLKNHTPIKKTFEIKSFNKKTESNKVELKVSINNNLKNEIEYFLKANKITYNVLFQSIWAHLLKLYTKRSDIVYGITASGRPASIDNIDQLVGVLTNNIPIRINFNNCNSFKEVLRKIQKQNVEVQDFSYISLDKMLEYSNISSGTLFESLFVFQNYPYDETEGFEVNNVSFSKMKNNGPGVNTNYPLTFLGSSIGDDTDLRIIFDTKVFTSEAMSNFVINFKHILNEVIDNSDKLIKDLNLKIPFTELEKKKNSNKKYTKPRTPFEELLCDIWKDLIDQQEIGIDDNFFDLGGHSLIIIQMIDRIRDRFGIQLPVKVIFERPTIKELAIYITELKFDEVNK